MSQTSGTRVLPPNIPDGFLNKMRRGRLIVSRRMTHRTDLSRLSS